VNIAGGVAQQLGKVTAREKYADGLVVPKTRRAEPIEAQGKANEENQKEKRAKQGWTLHGVGYVSMNDRTPQPAPPFLHRKRDNLTAASFYSK
jgi:hypothetical protein